MNGYKTIDGKKDNGDVVTLVKPKNAVIPNALDWRTKGYVTPVKKQGQCRSDWVISAVCLDNRLLQLLKI